jgi:hypothetical protein|eukprot:1953810-Prymnesium_polylepis.1
MRMRYKYHLEDEHLSSFLAHTPVFNTWDDHEIVDDWGGASLVAQGKEQLLEDGKRACEPAVARLCVKHTWTFAMSENVHMHLRTYLTACVARVAVFEYWPVSGPPEEPRRLYRTATWGRTCSSSSWIAARTARFTRGARTIRTRHHRWRT